MPPVLSLATTLDFAGNFYATILYLTPDALTLIMQMKIGRKRLVSASIMQIPGKKVGEALEVA